MLKEQKQSVYSSPLNPEKTFPSKPAAQAYHDRLVMQDALAKVFLHRGHYRNDGRMEERSKRDAEKFIGAIAAADSLGIFSFCGEAEFQKLLPVLDDQTEMNIPADDKKEEKPKEAKVTAKT